MKQVLVIVLSVIVLSAAVCAVIVSCRRPDQRDPQTVSAGRAAPPAVPTPTLALSYRQNFHCSWSIKDNELKKSWLVAKDDGKKCQNLSAYTSHEKTVVLSRKDIEWFTAWVQRNKVFDYKYKYTRDPDDRSYEAAVRFNTLLIKIGRKEHTLSWFYSKKLAPSFEKGMAELLEHCAALLAKAKEEQDKSIQPPAKRGGD